MELKTSTELRRNVSLLGRLLGNTIRAAYGDELFEKIEAIRQTSKSARAGDSHNGGEEAEQLLETLSQLSRDELLPVARAFSQFLNLANIADQHHTISRSMDSFYSATETLASLFRELEKSGCSKEMVLKEINRLNIELVLTAHPTEITRRTLIHKLGEVHLCLSQLELKDLTEREQQAVHERLSEVVAQIWHTHDFRCQKPSPIDEAKWGYAVIENSLWQAVPNFLRRLDSTLYGAIGHRLPVAYAPVRLASWMGGDRDGNPNVTARVTHVVLLLARWKAADLYIRDVEILVEELSMIECDSVVRDMAGEAREPYRAVLKGLRDKLVNTRNVLKARMDGREAGNSAIIGADSELWDPLFACYESLCVSGMATIANGKLLDLLRRVKCFGVNLLKLDVRQDSDRHSRAIAEITRFLELGDYETWSESEKQAFLCRELNSRRPLVPLDWKPSAEVQEVLDTCRVVAEQEGGGIGCYIISMARQPSDVLAVKLLLKAMGMASKLPIVPLFETLDDLNRSAHVVDQLLRIPGYKDEIGGKLMVMIGYSDSAKDAGVLAASWAQYRAQENLLAVCGRENVELTLFHGRGGSIGRGSLPAHAALLSQPPGSLSGGLRVTEQGEMIRTKLGLQGIAIKTLALYTSAILQANLHKPPSPKTEWRKTMDRLSEASCASYRSYVRDMDDFVAYFRQATPEIELTRLPLGSRPARRNRGGGIESLRAIPWIFAWTQNRLMLPAWLGAGKALEDGNKSGDYELFREMADSWPFFRTRLTMLEMVFAKADLRLSEYYDWKLVDPALRPIGVQLRTQLKSDIRTVLNILNRDGLLENDPLARESILLRNIYTDPLNLLQAELLARIRQEDDEVIEEALMVTISGIAAGMRNTG
jgi:phosphoenolpyruvate carboxylase